MFHRGDRVLIHTPYGLLPARVVGFDGPHLFAVRPQHPHYTNEIYAKECQLRYLWDWPATEQPLHDGRLATSTEAADLGAFDGGVQVGKEIGRRPFEGIRRAEAIL